MRWTEFRVGSTVRIVWKPRLISRPSLTISILDILKKYIVINSYTIPFSEEVVPNVINFYYWILRELTWNAPNFHIFHNFFFFFLYFWLRDFFFLQTHVNSCKKSPNRPNGLVQGYFFSASSLLIRHLAV